MAGAGAMITPIGVRDGERSTLRALGERRGGAVLAYCEWVCAPGHTLDAAAEAFARFRATVVAAPQLDDVDPEAMLLSATRHAAAERAPAPPPPGRMGLPVPGWYSCPLVPELLAARADGQLSGADLRRLERHLERCAPCQESERRVQAGELAYRGAGHDAPAELAIEAIERALRAAAPAVAGAPASDPAAPRPADLEPAAGLGPGPHAWQHHDDDKPPTDVDAHWEPAAAGWPAEDPVPASARVPGGGDPNATMAWSLDAGDSAPHHQDPNATMAWSLDAGDSAPHHQDPNATMAPVPATGEFALEHDDPDATMAWALDAPDFDGEILAADLREARFEPSAMELDSPAAPRPLRRARRALLPVVIAALVIIVALALVGSLSGSGRQRTPPPVSRPIAAPGAVGSSTIDHTGRHRAGGRRANPSARGRTTSTAGSARVAGIRATLPGAPSSSPVSPRSARAPTARQPARSPRPRPGAPAKATPGTSPTTPGAGAPSPAPSAAPPTAAPTAPVGSGSPGGTAAPAP
jgi:putative zinc finger protein